MMTFQKFMAALFGGVVAADVSLFTGGAAIPSLPLLSGLVAFGVILALKMPPGLDRALATLFLGIAVGAASLFFGLLVPTGNLLLNLVPALLLGGVVAVIYLIFTAAFES